MYLPVLTSFTRYHCIPITHKAPIKPKLSNFTIICTEIKVSAKIDKEEQNNEDGPCMKIIYVDPYYLRFDNDLHFGFESFLSGVGGFIGIFLGYSLLQIPELLENCLGLFGRRNAQKQRSRRRVKTR